MNTNKDLIINKSKLILEPLNINDVLEIDNRKNNTYYSKILNLSESSNKLQHISYTNHIKTFIKTKTKSKMKMNFF